MLFQGQYVKIL